MSQQRRLIAAWWNESWLEVQDGHKGTLAGLIA
jgi:hypothetical protein